MNKDLRPDQATSHSPAFGALPFDETGEGPRQPLRICIASYDLVGPIRNGGVGTAFTSLAEALASAGHDVTLLYLSGQLCESMTLDHWVNHYRKKNIRFIPLPDQLTCPLVACWHQAKSYETYLWLKEQSFDVIHFSEWRGPGYYSILARRQGHAFPSTALCVHTHGPTLWSRLSDAKYVNEPEDLDLDFLERRSVQWADLVVSPSQYLFQWMIDQGWSLPERSFVQQYIRPTVARQLPTGSPHERVRPDELVFFGRLEVRKGLVHFCDALEHLKDDPALRHLTITFLGKYTEVNGVPGTHYLENRARAWPWKWQVFSELDQKEALSYLQGGLRLALIPSVADNLPNTVLECLGARVPFLASDIGGIPEMIAPSDLPETCFPLRAACMSDRIRRAVADGVKPAAAAVDPAWNENAWIRWHETQISSLTSPPSPEEAAAARETPLVSVCISTFNRPHLLQQAIDSIEAQNYPNIELVLIDDASHDPKALAHLRELEPKFTARHWQLIRNEEELFVGAARNIAARHARGEYLLFMDDDNCAKPHEVSTFVRAALRTKADIVTCFLDFFGGYDRPQASTPLIHRVVFLGDAAAGGALRNTFGDTNALIRKSAFLELGGFHERRHVGHEDWQLYADAVLKGYHLEVVPEALVWYRRNESEHFATRNNSLHAGHMQNIQPYLDAVPAELRNLILFVQGQYIQLEKGQGQTVAAFANSQHTIRWRSAYGAGLALARMGHKEQAIHLLLDALKAAEASEHPGIILEALLHIGKDLRPLDVNRARQALQLAKNLSLNLKNEPAFKKAQLLSQEMSGQNLSHPTRPADSSTPAAPPSTASTDLESVEVRADLDSDWMTNPLGTESESNEDTPDFASIDDALAHVAQCLNAHRDRSALDAIDRTLAAQPAWTGLLYARAVVLGRLERFEDAKAALLRLPEGDQAHAKVHQLLRELDDASQRLQAV